MSYEGGPVADPKEEALYVSCSGYGFAGIGRFFVSSDFDMA
jgi:hypothetical protein